MIDGMADILAISIDPAMDISCKAMRVHATRKIRMNNQFLDSVCSVSMERTITTLGVPVKLVCFVGGANTSMLKDCLKS